MYKYSFLIGANVGRYTTGIGLFPKGRIGNRKTRVCMIDLWFMHAFLYDKNKFS